MLPSSTNHHHHHHHKPPSTLRRIPYSSWLLLLASSLLFLFFHNSPQSINFYFITTSTPSPQSQSQSQSPPPDPCSDRYIYIQPLPPKFNSHLLRNCSSLNQYIHMCNFIVNSGFGPSISNTTPIFSTFPGWFHTNQFSLEIIFHARLLRYQCLTPNPSQASAVFVPFYPGLDVSRHLWSPSVSLRDADSLSLSQFLSSSPNWSPTHGKNHFMVAGRVAWDFRRASDDPSDWGNRMMLLPESQNMTILTIEASTAPDSTDLGIPYPTWFHPSSDGDVRRWTNGVRRKKRKYLYSFAGAPRPEISDSIRNELIDECKRSSGKCNLLLCEFGTENCDDPESIMRLFQSSVFCLQPPGDTMTRRSSFDCMLAGCIPVFFHPRSAYLQYKWHLPDDYTRYSVFIPKEDVKSGRVSVGEELSRIPEERVEAMREEVLRLIPSIVYADFGSKERGRSFEDAFDLAVKGVLERINGFKKGS